MFPAHAGMNQDTFLIVAGHRNVPRTRGDEPLKYPGPALIEECSPHTRG